MARPKCHPTTEHHDPVCTALASMTTAIRNEADLEAAVQDACRSLSPAQQAAVGQNITEILKAMRRTGGQIDSPIHDRLSDIAESLISP